MLAELIIYHGVEINTSQLIADHVGLMDLLVQLLIESIFSERELGQTWTYLLKLLSIVKLVDHATEVIQAKFMFMPTNMEFHNKPAKLMLQRTQIISAVQIFKNARIVLLLLELNLEIKVTVGLSLNIQFGKLLNTVQYLELIRWKLKSIKMDLFHVVLMLMLNCKLIQVVFSPKQNSYLWLTTK